MLLRHGPDPQEGPFLLDDEYTTEEYEELHETFEALGASTKLVCLFTAGPESGIHVIHWGDAHLEPDRTFTWLYSEQLRVATQRAAPMLGRPWTVRRRTRPANGDRQ
ncbi:hypothetical protein AB0A91_31315 [Streptomyces sp. NPDC042207]|uniref:hypothetical protein n=1 Tax=Streptomyces sp. NPDC042207 TaxID=3154331 RepID=UPI0033E24E22